MGYLKITTYENHFKDNLREGIEIAEDTYHKDTIHKTKQFVNSLKNIIKQQRIQRILN
jgi:hypothetical protein